MKVVIVDGDVSYPATSGKRLRTLNLMLRLADRHQITYLGRCAAENDWLLFCASMITAAGRPLRRPSRKSAT